MKPSVKFGLINGGIGVLFNLILYITGLNRGSNSFQMIGLIIPIVCMVLAIKSYKEEIGNGWINFGKAFNLAFIVGLIGGAIGSVYHFLFIKFIDPSFIQFQLQQQQEKLADKGYDDVFIESALKRTEPFLAPPVQFGIAMVISVLFAAVIALIIAGIMKKPNPEEIG